MQTGRALRVEKMNDRLIVEHVRLCPFRPCPPVAGLQTGHSGKLFLYRPLELYDGGLRFTYAAKGSALTLPWAGKASLPCLRRAARQRYSNLG